MATFGFAALSTVTGVAYEPERCTARGGNSIRLRHTMIGTMNGVHGRLGPGPRVLVVEDDDASRVLLLHLLEREGYDPVGVTDGTSALIEVEQTQPDLVLLDVGLPHMDGYEVSRQLRANPNTMALPVILLTARTSLEDVVTGLDAGADDFVTKPFHQAELLARIRSALRLRQALVRMETAHAVVAALANAVEAKDTMTEHHCQRLANMAARLGARAGLSVTELEAVAYGALLHDVGKIGVPESILSKAGPLDDDEWAQMRRHPEIGERICSPLGFSRLFTPIVAHHHERWDGRGYPSGLRREAIPFGARIVGLVDAFDAMTHDRPYRRALPIGEAIEELHRQAGGQFDPGLVPLFVAELGRIEAGRVATSDLPPTATIAGAERRLEV